MWRDAYTLIPPEVMAQILAAIASMIGLLVLWLMTQAIQYLKTKVSRDRSDQLASAIDKLVMWGVTRADGMIRQRGPEGWSDPAVKRAVVSDAMRALPEKFPQALAQSGLSLDDPHDRVKLQDAIERAIPEVFARAAASPATPPGPIPPVPAVVVSDVTRP